MEEKVLGASTGDAKLLEAGEGALYLLVPELDCLNVLYHLQCHETSPRFPLM